MSVYEGKTHFLFALFLCVYVCLFVFTEVNLKSWANDTLETQSNLCAWSLVASPIFWDHFL